jgi:glycosyltransferase involved in cell wall biosynthesis
VLAVGTIEPRKNMKRLVSAMEKLWKNNSSLSLVITGKQCGYDLRVHKTRMRMTGYVPERDLPILYSMASVFVYPSLYEGFGLPILEAMSCGIPVITSNRASMPDVGGDAALYVDPTETDALAHAIERITSQDTLRRELISKGLARVQRYSWQTIIKQYLKVIQKER